MDEEKAGGGSPAEVAATDADGPPAEKAAQKPAPRRGTVEQLIQLVGSKFLYVALDQARFSRLPEKLRGFATNANEDLLLAAGRFAGGDFRDPYIYTSAKLFLSGSAALNQIKRYEHVLFTDILVSPVLLLKNIEQLRIERMRINFGCPDWYEVRKDQFDELEHLALLVRLAKIDCVMIVQTREGFAVPMELDGKEYAIGFLEEDEGIATIRGLEQTLPKVKLEPNPPALLARDILNSPYEGIIFNPASATQAIITRPELEKLILASEVLKRRLFSLDTLRSLFRMEK